MKKGTSGRAQPPGVSLIIAIVFVSAFMLVIAGLAEATLRGIRMRGNWETSSKAFYFAESAQEIANKWAVSHGMGANSADDAVSVANALESLQNRAVATGISNCLDMDPDPTRVRPCINFEVVGRATETVRIGLSAPDYYSVPMKGSGDAATTCENADDANDACHWNKLRSGESVEIPLYYESDMDGDGDLDIVKPNFAPMNSFRLRIRAPCEGYATDPNGCNSAGAASRIELYPMVSANPTRPFRHIEKDPVLVQWLISEGAAAGTSTLVARDIRDARIDERRPLPTAAYVGENTEISGGRINDANPSTAPAFVLTDFIILEKDYYGLDLSRVRRTIQEFLATQTEPILRLSLVSQPRRDDGFADTELTSADLNNPELDVPYLEYQLLTLDPISDAKSIVIGWAEIGDFRKEIRRFRHRSTTLGGFVLEQF